MNAKRFLLLKLFVAGALVAPIRPFYSRPAIQSHTHAGYNVCARTTMWAARLVTADHAALESRVSSLMLGVIQRVVETSLR